MTNINKHAVRETTKVDIDGPDGEKLFEDDGSTPLFVEIHGPASKVYANAQTRQQDRWMEKVRKHGKNFRESTDERLKREAEFLAEISISANFTHNDAPLDSKEAFALLYNNLELGFIKDQVNKAAGDYANFKKA